MSRALNYLTRNIAFIVGWNVQELMQRASRRYPIPATGVELLTLERLAGNSRGDHATLVVVQHFRLKG